MKAGVKVRYTRDGKMGVSHGPTFQYGVWWILVEWLDSKQRAIVLEQFLEVVER